MKDMLGKVKESDIVNGTDIYASIRELGEGDIDLKTIFDILRSINYDGYLCAEIDRTRFTHKQSAAMNFEYLKKNW